MTQGTALRARETLTIDYLEVMRHPVLVEKLLPVNVPEGSRTKVKRQK